MVCLSQIAGSLAAACLIGTTVAHPGEFHDYHTVKRQVRDQNSLASAAKRSISTCSDSLKHRQVAARSVARRAETARELRKHYNVQTKSKKYRRDLATLEVYEAINHNYTGKLNYTVETGSSNGKNFTGTSGYSNSTDVGTLDTTIFSANTSCILTPEVTDGPYYVVGERIRKNVTEDQAGIPLHLEVQYLDINTCLPVEGVYVDIWNANATGVYSGINGSNNFAERGWSSTYLRGIQITDWDGVVAFDTIFPGHYYGRATHTHLLAHENVTVLANDTITGGTITHIGQIFYNEVLRDAVEDTYPYSTNTQAITSNEADQWAPTQADNDYDPFPEYLYLGDQITDGLLAWIQIGINVTADQTNTSDYTIAAYWQADGGHENTNPETSFQAGP